MGGGGSKPSVESSGSTRGASGGGHNDGGGGGSQAASGQFQEDSSNPRYIEMDDEVAQATADLLFDLLPYYGTGNQEADDIFIATVNSNSLLPHSRDAHGNTLLMIACQAMKRDLIELMLRKDVDVNAQNYMGVSALHILC